MPYSALNPSDFRRPIFRDKRFRMTIIDSGSEDIATSDERMGSSPSDPYTFGDPQGAFFIYTDASSSGIQAFELSYLLLREGHVLIFPGTAFGDKWVDWLRISLLQPQDQLALALERMAGVLKRHR